MRHVEYGQETNSPVGILYYKKEEREIRRLKILFLRNRIETNNSEYTVFEEKSMKLDGKLVQLYEIYYHNLWYVALGYLKDAQLAEDMVQETFIKVAEKPGSVQEVDSKMTRYFLITILRNKCIDYIRKTKRSPETSLEDWEVCSDYGDIPLTHVLRKESMSELNQIIDSLDAAYRDPLKYRYIEGLSNQEIAQRTHMSTNLVAVRINRAKKMLRSRIDRANFYMG